MVLLTRRKDGTIVVHSPATLGYSHHATARDRGRWHLPIGSIIWERPTAGVRPTRGAWAASASHRVLYQMANCLLASVGGLLDTEGNGERAAPHLVALLTVEPLDAVCSVAQKKSSGLATIRLMHRISATD